MNPKTHAEPILKGSLPFGSWLPKSASQAGPHRPHEVRVGEEITRKIRQGSVLIPGTVSGRGDRDRTEGRQGKGEGVLACDGRGGRARAEAALACEGGDRRGGPLPLESRRAGRPLAAARRIRATGNPGSGRSAAGGPRSVGRAAARTGTLREDPRCCGTADWAGPSRRSKYGRSGRTEPQIQVRRAAPRRAAHVAPPRLPPSSTQRSMTPPPGSVAGGSGCGGCGGGGGIGSVGGVGG